MYIYTTQQQSKKANLLDNAQGVIQNTKTWLAVWFIEDWAPENACTCLALGGACSGIEGEVHEAGWCIESWHRVKAHRIKASCQGASSEGMSQGVWTSSRAHANAQRWPHVKPFASLAPSSARQLARPQAPLVCVDPPRRACLLSGASFP